MLQHRGRALGSATTATTAGTGATAAYGAATAVFDSTGRVLLVRHTYGVRNWELPGGLSEPGEDPLSTARRELREETGLELMPERLTGLYFEAHHRLGPFLHVIFRAAAPRGQLPTPSSPEIDDAAYWSIDALPRPLSDFTSLRIDDARHQGTRFAVIGNRRWLP